MRAFLARASCLSCREIAHPGPLPRRGRMVRRWFDKARDDGCSWSRRVLTKKMGIP